MLRQVSRFSGWVIHLARAVHEADDFGVRVMVVGQRMGEAHVAEARDENSRQEKVLGA